MSKSVNELVAETLDTIISSLPIDPADQAKLRENVDALHAHNKPAKKAPASKDAKPADKKPSVTNA